MQIIDRYLLWQFLKVFVICFFSLTGLYIVIDGFANLDDFMIYADEHGKLLPVMLEYYTYRSLSFFDRTSGILTLIAAMFTITWIQRHQELTALEAAGLSKGRIIKPVILAVAAISLLAAANRELVIALPRVRNHLSHNAQNLHGRKAQSLQQRYDNATNILLRGAANPGRGTVHQQTRLHPPRRATRRFAKPDGRAGLLSAAARRPAGRIPVRKPGTPCRPRSPAVAGTGRQTGDLHAARHPLAEIEAVLRGQRRQLRTAGRGRIVAALFVGRGNDLGLAQS